MIVANAVLVLRSLVQIRIQQQQNVIAAGGLPPQTFSPLEIISRLARRIDDIRHPKARACVVWLVGQYAASPAPAENGTTSAGPEGIAPWAPDVLRKMAKSFIQEVKISFPVLPSVSRPDRPPLEQTPVVKLQVVTLAAKLLVLCPTDRTIGLLYRYVCSLAQYDPNYDVRDRARMYRALLSSVTAGLYGEADSDREDVGGVVLRREQIKVVLFEGKASPDEDVTKDGKLTHRTVRSTVAHIHLQRTTMADSGPWPLSRGVGRAATGTSPTGWRKASTRHCGIPRRTCRRPRYTYLNPLLPLVRSARPVAHRQLSSRPRAECPPRARSHGVTAARQRTWT